MQLTRSRWPIFGAFIIGIVLVGGFWYTVLASPEGDTVPASGGRYVEAVRQPPGRINPLFAPPGSTDADIASLVFSGLVRLGPDGTPQPDLAERWEITGNGTSYVFHLRRGVAWHDSPDEALTARDVVFTYEAISDPGFRGDPTLAQLMDGVIVTARDPETVEFRLEQAYSPFLAYLTVGILPEHLLRDLDAAGLYGAAFNIRPVGTGPYRLREVSEQGAVLEANPTYHFGPPHIETIEFSTYVGTDDMVEALRDGTVDGALLPYDVSDADVEVLDDIGGMRLHELTATSTLSVYFDTRSPLFEDPAVRRALIQAVSPPLLLDDLDRVRGAPARPGIDQGWWAQTTVAGNPFEPGEAASGLELAGWQRGRDGVRRKGDLRLAFTLSTTNDAQRVTVAEHVARQWSAIGAEVTVQPLDSGTFVDEILLDRRFQAALAEIDPGPDPDPYPFWHSSQVSPAGRNFSGFTDGAMDDALERARQTTDVDRRRELYETYAGYLVVGAPALPLFHPVSTYVQRERVRGVEPSLLFTTASRFSNVHAWYVKTRVR